MTTELTDAQRERRRKQAHTAIANAVTQTHDPDDAQEN